MYNVSKGPSKIVAKTRRGLSQNFEKFESIKESGKRSGSDSNSPENNIVPKPVFQTKKLYAHPATAEEEVITPQHEEIIKYINESWNIVVAQNPYDRTPSPCLSTDSNNNNAVSLIKSHTNNYNNNNSGSNINGINNNNNSSNNYYYNYNNSTQSTSTSLYCVEPPSPVLSDFKPFDLESWWGRRLFNNITKSL